MPLTEQRDLRGGKSLWVSGPSSTIASDAFSHTTECEALIIGGGVMGAMLAERLTAAGRSVVVVDRRPPAHGSTAASTALVMWASDVPLTHLARSVGMPEAARRWRRVHRALTRLDARIDALGIDCAKDGRGELYLAGSLLDEGGLRAEGEARRAAGLPSDFLDGGAVATRFAIPARAALLSADAFELDPVRLTLGMLAIARQRGARLCFPFDVERIEQVGSGTRATASDGRTILASEVILASGYERALLFLPDDFTVGSTYAIATATGQADAWREDIMLWEASSPYVYARKGPDGRIIAGGGDEELSDPQARDRLLATKSGLIAAGVGHISGTAVAAETRWSAHFGTSPDGLPAIGRARNHDNLWLASGFGGNGVTFAALGAELIAADMSGSPDADAAGFDPYRFG